MGRIHAAEEGGVHLQSGCGRPSDKKKTASVPRTVTLGFADPTGVEALYLGKEVTGPVGRKKTWGGGEEGKTALSRNRDPAATSGPKKDTESTRCQIAAKFSHQAKNQGGMGRTP